MTLRGCGDTYVTVDVKLIMLSGDNVELYLSPGLLCSGKWLSAEKPLPRVT